MSVGAPLVGRIGGAPGWGWLVSVATLAVTAGLLAADGVACIGVVV